MTIGLGDCQNMPLQTERWLALVIGNTRLHWGAFNKGRLEGVWHTPHLTAKTASQLIESRFIAESWRSLSELTLDGQLNQLPRLSIEPSAVWMASAVSEQTNLWGSWSRSTVQIVARSHICLSNLYPTLGIDRAINLLGAGNTVGWPVLVIDAGTALTFTAGIEQAEKGSVYGGAILPGLRLQGRALGQKAPALAEASIVGKAFDEKNLALMPERWATSTSEAIASGLTYGAIATITDYLIDWWQHFPKGRVILTGGDSPLLYSWLQKRTPEVASKVQVDSCLMFRGMQVYRRALTLAS